MKNIIRPYDDDDRLAAVAKLNLVSGESEERFDRITRIAQRMFAVPIADFSLIDRHQQRLISRYGLDVPVIERDISMANYALLKNEVFVVPDARADERFAGNPLVVDRPRIRFFAAMPIRSKSGHRIGALSIADRDPRGMSAQDQSVMRDLAEMIENEIAFMEVTAYDRLTQLAINDGFFSRAEQGLKVCEREQSPAIALVFDVKNLMLDGDQGADKDRHVKAFADQLRHCFRKSDVVGRLSSEAFSALLLNARAEHVAEIVQKLQEAVDQHNASAGARAKLEFRHASAEFDPAHPISSSALVDMASRALERLAKVV